MAGLARRGRIFLILAYGIHKFFKKKRISKDEYQKNSACGGLSECHPTGIFSRIGYAGHWSIMSRTKRQIKR